MRQRPSRFLASLVGLFSLISLFSILFLSAALPARAADTDTQDFVLEPKIKKTALFESGMGVGVLSDLGWQPQLAGYLDLGRSFQMGLQIRVVTSGSTASYDYLPETTLQLRKLWLG